MSSNFAAKLLSIYGVGNVRVTEYLRPFYRFFYGIKNVIGDVIHLSAIYEIGDIAVRRKDYQTIQIFRIG